MEVNISTSVRFAFGLSENSGALGQLVEPVSVRERLWHAHLAREPLGGRPCHFDSSAPVITGALHRFLLFDLLLCLFLRRQILILFVFRQIDDWDNES